MISTTKGLYYSKGETICHGCQNISLGYYKITKDGIETCRCKTCMKSIPSLMFWSNSILIKMTKTYTLDGKYLRRKYNCNHFKLKSNEPLLILLKVLKQKGFKVPVFGGGKRQIAVTTGEILDDSNIDKEFILKVKLNYWSNTRNMKKGYKIIPI